MREVLANFPSVGWINLAGWCHLAYFGILLPGLVIRARLKHLAGERPLPDRRRHFRATTIELTGFTAISLLVARTQRLDLFPFPGGTGAGLVAGLAMFFATVFLMRPRWRRAVERRAPIVRLFMPANAAERAWWIGVSLLAGVGEEITWRGVQTGLLVGLTHDYWIAALISAAGFGVAHMIQGWRSAAIVVLFALGFQLVVWLSGSLYVAILVHVAYDITAGLTYGRLGRELGYDLKPRAEGP